jgi:hypothetical protein
LWREKAVNKKASVRDSVNRSFHYFPSLIQQSFAAKRTDVMTFYRYFRRNICRKYCAFFAQTTAIFYKNLIITLVFGEQRQVFLRKFGKIAENCDLIIIHTHAMASDFTVTWQFSQRYIKYWFFVSDQNSTPIAFTLCPCLLTQRISHWVVQAKPVFRWWIFFKLYSRHFRQSNGFCKSGITFTFHEVN